MPAPYTFASSTCNFLNSFIIFASLDARSSFEDPDLKVDSVTTILMELHGNREDWPSVVKAWPTISSAMMLLSDKQQKAIIAYKDEIKAHHRDGKGMI